MEECLFRVAMDDRWRVFLTELLDTVPYLHKKLELRGDTGDARKSCVRAGSGRRMWSGSRLLPSMSEPGMPAMAA
jgi:hypothetical protein